MNKSFQLLVILVISHFAWAGVSTEVPSLNRVNPDDQALKKLSALYRTSGQLVLSPENIMTYQDLINALDGWEKQHNHQTVLQERLLQEIHRMLSEDEYSQSLALPELSAALGFDFLYKPQITSQDSTDSYFTDFKGRDFQTTYSNRGSLLDIGLNSRLHPNINVDIHYSARSDWEQMNHRDYHHPRNMEEINFDVNSIAYVLFRIKPMTLLIGRDRVSLGPGNHGKLLLSDNIPALDQIRFQYRYNQQITFNNIVAPVKFHSDPDSPPKTLIVHRLEWMPLKNLRVGIFEGIITNQHLRLAYMNPFMIHHNVSDYALKRNALAGFDIEFLMQGRIRTWLSVLIDELDVSFVENVEDGQNRQALGIQAGMEWFEPLQIAGSQFVVEWVHLDEWLYNYPYARGELTFVYEEERFYQGQYKFNRFIGHYLGSNADAVYIDCKLNAITLTYQYIQQGEVNIYQPAFTETLHQSNELKQIVGFSLKDVFLNNEVGCNGGLFYTTVKNYHNISGWDEQYPEIWVQLSYRLF